MPLKKYFKEEQKVFLRTLNNDSAGRRVDALTCFLKAQGNGYIDLTIPYGTNPDERYPFDPEKKIEILSDSMGVGIRLTGHFEKYLKNDIIRLQHNSDIQLIHRRVEERRAESLELGYTKGKGKLRSFRQQWEKNVKILENVKDSSKLPKFPKVKVDISMTGVGFKIKAPIAVSDLCLLFINLDDGLPPVCTMTEVVWCRDQETDGRCLAGFQYLNILESDCKRISKFVKKSAKKEA